MNKAIFIIIAIVILLIPSALAAFCYEDFSAMSTDPSKFIVYDFCDWIDFNDTYFDTRGDTSASKGICNITGSNSETTNTVNSTLMPLDGNYTIEMGFKTISDEGPAILSFQNRHATAKTYGTPLLGSWGGRAEYSSLYFQGADYTNWGMNRVDQKWFNVSLYIRNTSHVTLYNDTIELDTQIKDYTGVDANEHHIERGHFGMHVYANTHQTLYDFIIVYNGTDCPTVSLDTTPPVISDLYDQTGGGTNRTSDTTPTISLTTDEAATCNLSKTNVSDWIGFSTTGGTSHIGTLSAAQAFSIGYPMNITVNCSDVNLNSAYATIQYNITDGIPPNISLSRPLNDTEFMHSVNNTFALNFTATDNHFKTLRCNLTINQILNQTNYTVDNGTLTNWDTHTYEIGTYTWNTSCTDGHNNTNSSVRTFTVIAQTCTANSVSLYLDGQNDSRKYEFGSTVNISANATGTLDNGSSCSPEMFIDLDAPNYGVNYTNGTRNINLIYNITLLRQSNFTKGENESRSVSGQFNVSMDNRTDITYVAFNLSSEGTTNSLIVNKKGIRGILTDTHLKDTEFVYSGNYLNRTNLTYVLKGSRSIYFNFSDNPFNLTFKIWGFDTDVGNDVNFFEYFNDSNLSKINVKNLTNISLLAAFDNFETNRTVWELMDWDVYPHEVELPTTGTSDDNLHLWYGQTISTGTSTFYYAWNEDDNLFDVRNLTKINLELYQQCYGLGKKDTPAPGESSQYDGHNYIYFTDGTTDVIMYNLECPSQNSNPNNNEESRNLTFRKIDDTHWWSPASLQGWSSQSVDIAALSGRIWLKFGTTFTCGGDPVATCDNGQRFRIWNQQISGIMLNKSWNSDNFSSFGTIYSDVIAETDQINNYTGAFIYAHHDLQDNITYEVSADNGSNWKDVTAFVNGPQKFLFDVQGNKIRYRINLSQNTTFSPIVYDLNIQVIPSSIENISIDLGDDNVEDFVFVGILNSTTSPIDVKINTSAIHRYNNTFTEMTIASGSSGQIQIDNSVINSSVNPIVLNETEFEDCSLCQLNVSFVNSAIRAYALAFDFLGSWNYTATAHTNGYSDSHLINVFYSKFNVSFGSGINWYDVFPGSKDAKNVSPAGQSKTNPIWNITSLSYDAPFDVYVKTNETLTCFNITYSNRSVYITNYTVHNESFIWINQTKILLNNSKIYSNSVVVFNQTSIINHKVDNESFTWLNGTEVSLNYGNITIAIVFNQTNAEEHFVVNESFTWINNTKIYLGYTNIVSGSAIVFNQTTTRNNYVANESITLLNGTAVELANDDIVFGSVVVFNQTTARDHYVENESFVWLNNTAVTLNNQNIVPGTVVVFNQTTTRNNYVENENVTFLNGTKVALANKNIVVDSIVIFNQTSNVTVVNESDLNALLWKNNTRMNLDNVNSNVTSLYRCNDSLVIPTSNYTVLYSAGEIVCLDNSSDYYDNMTVCANYTYFVSEIINLNNYLINYTEGNITLITNYRDGSQLGINYTYTTQNVTVVSSNNYTINYTTGIINLTSNYFNNTQFGINYTYNTFVSEIVGLGNYTINYAIGNITLITNYFNNTQFGINYSYTTQNSSTIGSGNYTINYTEGTINLTSNYFNNTQFGINYTYVVSIDSIIGSDNYTINYLAGTIKLISNYFNNTQFGINYTYWTQNSSEVIGSDNYTIDYADGTINLTTGYKDETQFGINYTYYTETYGYDSTLDNFKLNTSYQKIFQNLSVSDWRGIWNWCDLTNCTGRFYIPYVYFSAVCSGCVFDIDQLDNYNWIME